jgi:hypothetical protein
MKDIEQIMAGESTLLQLQILFAETLQANKAKLPLYCIKLQESLNPEFCEFGVQEAEKLTEAQIIINLVPLVEAKGSHCQAKRDLTGKILNRISSEELGTHLLKLIKLVRSPVYFVEMEAERLLAKIKPEHLFEHFEYLQTLLDDGDKDVRKMAKTLILKTAVAWPLEKKIKYYDFAVQLKNRTDCKKAQAVGNLLTLQVMTTWKTSELKPHLSFLMQCTNTETNDFVVSEIAASLALQVFFVSDLPTRITNVGYLASFNYYGNKVLRREFRHLALLTIKELDEKDLPNFALFFFQCLEAKSHEDRTLAWQYLLQIDPNALPITDLINCQACGLFRVRRASKKLGLRISTEVLAQNLEVLLNAQNSEDPDVRGFACRLATSIPIVRLRQERTFLEKYKKARSPYVKDLAECLLFLI